MAPNPYENVNVYGRNQKNQQQQASPTGNSRETDARALLTSASRMSEAKAGLAANMKSKDSLKAYGEAIRANQRLWTIFQVALSDPEHAFPTPLKRVMLGLCRYVDTTSFRAVGKYVPDLVDSLININLKVATGLSKQPPAHMGAPPPPPEVRDIPTSLTTSA